MTGKSRDEENVEKDTSYSPGSERETREAQQIADPPDNPGADDVDADEVKVQPGTGGPDDAGDVDIENTELHVPGRDSAG